jgi:hypothetical protein
MWRITTMKGGKMNKNNLLKFGVISFSIIMIVLACVTGALRSDRVISNEDVFEVTVDVPISIDGDCVMHNPSHSIRCPLFITNNLDQYISGDFELEVSSPNGSVTCSEFTNIGNDVTRMWLQGDTVSDEFFTFDCTNLESSALIYTHQSYEPLRTYEHPLMSFVLQENPPIKTYEVSPRVKVKEDTPEPAPEVPDRELHRQ